MNLQLTRRQLSCGSLILVNAAHPVPEDYDPEGVPLAGHPQTLLHRRAAAVLDGILRTLPDAEQIVPVSGLRSRSEQAKIYTDSLQENGTDFTRKYVALPDCSEHQTGLAIDLGLRSDSIDFIRPDFPRHGVCEDFRREAVRHGFIERYREEKQAVTGIAAEPWHFRYVGIPHAGLMEERQMALEEYIEYLKRFTGDRGPLICDSAGRRTEILFLPLRGDAVEYTLPDDLPCQISGNNDDGFILTVFQRSEP